MLRTREQRWTVLNYNHRFRTVPGLVEHPRPSLIPQPILVRPSNDKPMKPRTLPLPPTVHHCFSAMPDPRTFIPVTVRSVMAIRLA